MNNSPITFCISTHNNLNYLKLAVHSVRTYSHFKDAPFVIFAENCDKDETYVWLIENKEKYNLTTIIENNAEGTEVGIGGGMNECAKHVKTEYIMFLHSDFFVSRNWDLECLNIFDKYPNTPMWISSHRFQPNCFKENDRPGTIFFDYDIFGHKHDDFNERYFIEYSDEFSKLNPNIEIEKGEGVSGLIRKKDWDYIGGNDKLFAPASWDDTDLFIRMQLAGYKFILTSNSVFFHFGARGSHFPDDNLNVKSDRQIKCEERNQKNFYKKWGFWPIHNQYGFVTYPPNIDTEKYNRLIKI